MIAIEAGILYAALLIGTTFVTKHVPEPYMDEIFHVPQTIKYCEGRFSDWDPKITTFPGLYVAGAAYGHIAQRIRAISQLHKVPLCSAGTLRSLNAALATVAFICARQIHLKLHPGAAAQERGRVAALLALFPLHFFFCFLYYTDVGSLACCLACYLAVLHRRYGWSALAAAAATTMRQTNAVWAAFAFAVCAGWVALQQECLPLTQDREHLQQGLHGDVLVLLQQAWLLRGRLLRQLWSLALVPAAFAAFVVANGGVVVGDRTAHVPVTHLMQPLYFLLFSAGCLAPYHLHPARLKAAAIRLSAALHTRPLESTLALAGVAAAVALAVQRSTLVHPYMLADNRHYTFYMWKNLLRHAAIRYALVPVYVYSAWSVWYSLKGMRTRLWILFYFGATALTLVPAWLIEFRYFTTPFALLLLHMRQLSPVQARLTLLLYAVINTVTLSMFLFRPFRWPDRSVARFLW